VVCTRPGGFSPRAVFAVHLVTQYNLYMTAKKSLAYSANSAWLDTARNPI